MDRSIFEYLNYKKYLNDFITNQPKGGRGVRRRFAEAAGCQVAYVSHVLNGDYDFSLEHCEAIARFIGLNKDELEFLVLLLEKSRAGTAPLRIFFQNLIDEKTEKYFLLKNRVKISETLSREDQAQYYSKWYYAGIHIILTIPEFNSPERIADYFALPLIAVREVIDFLKSRGFVTTEKGDLKVTGKYLWLEKDSPFITQHHTIWRLKALQSLGTERSNDLHYTSCFSLSKDDAPKLKRMLSQTIADFTEIIKDSKEAALHSICLDFLEI